METPYELRYPERQLSDSSVTSSIMGVLLEIVNTTEMPKSLELPVSDRQISHNSDVDSMLVGLMESIDDSASREPVATDLGINLKGSTISSNNLTTNEHKTSELTRDRFFTKREEAKARTKRKREESGLPAQLEENSRDEILANRRIRNRESAYRYRQMTKDALQSSLAEVERLRLENAQLKQQVATLFIENEELAHQLVSGTSSAQKRL